MCVCVCACRTLVRGDAGARVRGSVAVCARDVSVGSPQWAPIFRQLQVQSGLFVSVLRRVHEVSAPQGCVLRLCTPACPAVVRVTSHAEGSQVAAPSPQCTGAATPPQTECSSCHVAPHPAPFTDTRFISGFTILGGLSRSQVWQSCLAELPREGHRECLPTPRLQWA